MQRIIFPALSLLLLMLPSCKKDELTLPSKVFFEFEMVSHREGNDQKGGPPFDLPAGRMTIDRGTLVISSIEFEGRRDEGRDVFFTSPFTTPVEVNLETGQASSEVSFDIPQGIYNRVEMLLEIGSAEGISLILEGKIGKGVADEILIRFEYNLREHIRIRAEPGRQKNRIILRKDTPSTARILIDAGEIFQFVNLSVLQNASISLTEGENMIVISPRNNIVIFNLMANRIDKSFRAIID